MNVSNMVHEPGISSYMMFLHQNTVFTLFAKFGLKAGMHINFTLLQQVNHIRSASCQAQHLLLTT